MRCAVAAGPGRVAGHRARPRPRPPAARPGGRRGAHRGRRVDAELERLHRAIDAVRDEMHALRERLHGALAQEVGEFLDLHALLLDDPELLQGLDELIRAGRCSAPTTRCACSATASPRVFEAMDDAYFRSRVEDIDQVIGRIHAALHRRDCELQGVAGEMLVADKRRARRTRAAAGAGRDGAGHHRRQPAVAQRDPRAQPAPAAGGRTAPDALERINDGDVLIVDGGSGPGGGRTRRRRPARTPRTRARRTCARRAQLRAAAARAHAHARRRRHPPVRERRIARGRRRGACAGRRRRRPVPHRIPVPAAQRTARTRTSSSAPTATW